MLSAEQLERFETEGYLVVEDLLSPETLTAVQAEYAAKMDELYAQWQAEGRVPVAKPGMGFWEKLDHCYTGGFDWYQPFDISLPHADITHETPMHHGPAVFQMATEPGILNVVEQLIGPEITSNPIQHVRIKPPERAVARDEIRAHVVATDWHQDQGVTLESADQTQMVTVWIAITDATVENGCLQVLPGPEKELLAHCTKAQTAISPHAMPDRAPVPAPVKAGGGVIFHPLTPHSSLSNTTDGYRWSFDLRYNVTGQNTGRPQFPDFVARSKANPASELRDWQAWRQMWEEARATLAVSEHIPQHRWPTDGPLCA